MAENTQDEIRQFYQGDGEAGPTLTPGNRVTYVIPALREGDEPVEIMVDCAMVPGRVPRDAAALAFKIDIQKEMEAVSRLAEIAFESLRKLEPGEVEIEFGIELGGALGIPLVTKHEAKANFKVTLKWANEKLSPKSPV